MSRTNLNDFLRDFSYRTRVKIVDNNSNEVIFTSTVKRYFESDLKDKGFVVEVADVFGEEFRIEVE